MSVIKLMAFQGEELVIYLQSTYLPAQNVDSELAQQFCRALKSDPKVFRNYFKVSVIYLTRSCAVTKGSSDTLTLKFRWVTDSVSNLCGIFNFRVSSPRPSHDHWNWSINIPLYILFTNFFAWYTWTCYGLKPCFMLCDFRTNVGTFSHFQREDQSFRIKILRTNWTYFRRYRKS